jgi:hypothetical protein
MNFAPVIPNVCAHCDLLIERIEETIPLTDGCVCHCRCMKGNRICLKHAIQNEDEKDEKLKIGLLTMPTQGGKTEEMIDLILQYPNDVHIIFTKSTKTTREQTVYRIDKKGILCFCLGSGLDVKFEGEYGNVRNFLDMNKLKSALLDNTPQAIVMCSTSKRLKEDLYEIILTLQKIVSSSGKNIHVYFDESQEYEGILQKGVRDKLEQNRRVKCMIHITATPDSLIEHVAPYVFVPKHFDKENYRGDDNCRFNPLSKTSKRDEEDFDKMEQFIDTERWLAGNSIVYKKFCISVWNTIRKNNVLKRNSFGFIPAKDRSYTHMLIARMCLRLNDECVVVVINSKDKKLMWEEDGIKQFELLDRNLPVSKGITKAREQHNLRGRPFVVTGHRCVLASQTFINTSEDPAEQFGPFTYAIFGKNIIKLHRSKSKIFNPALDEAEQIFGRLNWNKWRDGIRDVKTTVFCDTRFEQVVKYYGKIPMKINSLDGGKVLDRERYVKEKNSFDPLYTPRNIHVLRVVIGPKRLAEEDGWKDYESEGRYVFETKFYPNESSAFAVIRDIAKELHFNNNLHKKARVKEHEDFYCGNNGTKLNKICSIDEIRNCCGKYDISLERGNFYCAYRDLDDPKTLEYWYVYGEKRI